MTNTKRILFAINEETGTMKTFGSFKTFGDLADKLTSILSGDDPVGWPDGWTPYMYESCSGSFGHPVWYTPNPEETADEEWLPVGFDPLTDLPVSRFFETTRGDWVQTFDNKPPETVDAWVIEPRQPYWREILNVEWRQPTRQDRDAFDLGPWALVAEIGDFMAILDREPERGGSQIQVHGTTPDGYPIFWRVSLGTWADYS